MIIHAEFVSLRQYVQHKLRVSQNIYEQSLVV